METGGSAEYRVATLLKTLQNSSFACTCSGICQPIPSSQTVTSDHQGRFGCSTAISIVCSRDVAGTRQMTAQMSRAPELERETRSQDGNHL